MMKEFARRLPGGIGIYTGDMKREREDEANSQGKKRRKSSSCPSEAASTVVIRAEGLEKAWRESTARKLEQRAPLFAAQLRLAEAEVEKAKAETEKAKAETEKAKAEAEKAKAEAEKAKAQAEEARAAADEKREATMLKSSEILQVMEKNMLGELDRFDEMANKGELTARAVKQMETVKHRLNSVQKRLETLFSMLA